MSVSAATFAPPARPWIHSPPDGSGGHRVASTSFQPPVVLRAQAGPPATRRAALNENCAGIHGSSLVSCATFRSRSAGSIGPGNTTTGAIAFPTAAAHGGLKPAVTHHVTGPRRYPR